MELYREIMELAERPATDGIRASLLSPAPLAGPAELKDIERPRLAYGGPGIWLAALGRLRREQDAS